MLNDYIRPERNSVKALKKDVSALYNSLHELASSDVATEQLIAQDIGCFRQNLILQEMALIGIENLNADKRGIRVSALKNAGVANMFQLYGLSIYEIMRIDGIGEQSACSIKEVVDGAYNAIFHSIKIRIDLKNKTHIQNSLVKNLYLLKNGEELRNNARNALTYEQSVKSALRDLKTSSNSLRWFLSSKTKKASSIQAYLYLLNLMQSPFGKAAQSCIAQYNAISNQTFDTAYADFQQNAIVYYTYLEKLGHSTVGKSTFGLPEDLIAEVNRYPLDSTNMKATLREYQMFGAKYILNQRSVLLGDEMGLGKTVQALAAIADLKARGKTHFLVVCPASVLINWERETEKHTYLEAIVIHGAGKDDDLRYWKSKGGVGITNFESLTSLSDRINVPFAILIVDEAHLVKNPSAQRTQALVATSKFAEVLVFMTGTPLENRVDEMCFLVSCLRPDVAKSISKMKTLNTTQKFKDTLAPVYLRRTRKDVLGELPRLIENEDWLALSKVEENAYFSAIQSGNFMAMRRVSWNVGRADSCKANRLLELCEEAQVEGRKVIVFSFFRETLYKVCELLDGLAVGPITGSVSSTKRQELIDEFSKAENGKVLVAQVQAGGCGLNIQAASVIIFCEPQIKPSLETQAVSRAYRMGQTNNVLVHRLLCLNSVDEKMMTILRKKQNEFDLYADESVAGVESQKDQEASAWIHDLIAQERARIQALQCV